MKDSIFTLVPERVRFDQFWVEIRRRNRWLIMLRYGAVAMLTSLICGVYLLENIIDNFYLDVVPLWIIAISILLYNIVFHRMWDVMSRHRMWQLQKKILYPRPHFHSLHFSLLQITADFIALLLFIYFTGGIETPLFGFLIFHVIIGSLFLPGSVIVLIVTTTLLVSISGALLELYGIIPHYAIHGLLPLPLYNNTAFLIIFFTLFGLILYLSIYLANSVAKQLYRRERALTQAYSDLENAEKAKSRYVITVVHDLKTPISAAMTYINMLLEGMLGGQLASEHLKPLERSKKRLDGAINIINDILYISQLKLESSIENISDVNVTILFEEIINDMNVLINVKRIKLTYLYDSKEDTIIQAEPKILKMAFANLVSNAIKYSEVESKIEIIINNLKEYVLISVADSGIGIPETEQEKIYQDFYRSTLSKARGIEGTGLGMSIVSQVIKQLHGEIKVNSPSYLAEGATRPGTQFTLSLPKTYSAI